MHPKLPTPSPLPPKKYKKQKEIEETDPAMFSQISSRIKQMTKHVNRPISDESEVCRKECEVVCMAHAVRLLQLTIENRDRIKTREVVLN